MRQARLVLCCLDGERVVGKDDNSSSEAYYEIAVSALLLAGVHDETA